MGFLLKLIGAIALSAIITAALFALTFAWKLRRAFKAMERANKIMREGKHGWIERPISDSCSVRLPAFEAGKTEFEAAGFRHLGDIEDELTRRAFPGATAALRVFLSADSRTIGLLHVTRRNYAINDLEAVLDDGRVVCVCSAEDDPDAPSPREVHVEFFPGAPLDLLIERHGAMLPSHLRGARPVAIASLQEAIAVQNRISELRRIFVLERESREADGQ